MLEYVDAAYIGEVSGAAGARNVAQINIGGRKYWGIGAGRVFMISSQDLREPAFVCGIMVIAAV